MSICREAVGDSECPHGEFCSACAKPCGESITGSGPCATCGEPDFHHPEPSWVRFEWAETARPEGWWYYRTSDLAEPSRLRRDHPYAPSVFTCAAGHVTAGAPT